MSDRELLEAAAKAAGLEEFSYINGRYAVRTRHTGMQDWSPWNPLTDDGDALRLAVALLLEIHIYHTGVSVRIPTGDKVVIEADQEPDPYAATRRAIVRAAAAIGEKT